MSACSVCSGNLYHKRTRSSRARVGGKTVTVYYNESEFEIEVRGVSATTRKLDPSCGDEKVLLEDAKDARLYAERMGLGSARV